jgi:hypothetical protein
MYIHNAWRAPTQNAELYVAGSWGQKEERKGKGGIGTDGEKDGAGMGEGDCVRRRRDGGERVGDGGLRRGEEIQLEEE